MVSTVDGFRKLELRPKVAHHFSLARRLASLFVPKTPSVNCPWIGFFECVTGFSRDDVPKIRSPRFARPAPLQNLDFIDLDPASVERNSKLAHGRLGEMDFLIALPVLDPCPSRCRICVCTAKSSAINAAPRCSRGCSAENSGYRLPNSTS